MENSTDLSTYYPREIVNPRLWQLAEPKLEPLLSLDATNRRNSPSRRRGRHTISAEGAAATAATVPRSLRAFAPFVGATVRRLYTIQNTRPTSTRRRAAQPKKAMRTTAPLRETYPPGQTGVATEAQGTRVRARAPLQVRRKVYPRSATLMLLPPPPPLRKTQPTETRWHLHNRRSRRRCGRRAVTANAVTVRRRSTPRCPPPFEPLSTPTPQFSVRPSSFNGQNWRGGILLRGGPCTVSSVGSLEPYMRNTRIAHDHQSVMNPRQLEGGAGLTR